MPPVTVQCVFWVGTVAGSAGDGAKSGSAVLAGWLRAGPRCRPWKLTRAPLEPTGNGAPLSSAEDNGQRRHKRKRKKLLESEKGELHSLGAEGGRLAHTGLRERRFVL